MTKPASKYLSKLTKLAFVLVITNSVTGCIVALPPAVQLASFALDGISFATTGKTMSDHALSAMAEQDCAMSRALNGQAICTKDAQMAELEALEQRLDSPNAEQIAKTIKPADQDEKFKQASVQLAEASNEDEVLDEDISELSNMAVTEGPIL